MMVKNIYYKKSSSSSRSSRKGKFVSSLIKRVGTSNFGIRNLMTYDHRINAFYLPTDKPKTDTNT